MTNLENLTLAMNRLEIVIAKEQKYIAKWSEQNNKANDKQWRQMKEEAEYNLQKWDDMKKMRDNLKKQNA